jgi:hypothetical protein
MKKLLNKVQNLQTKNQETLAKKNRVILSKPNIPLKKNFKNYSYGIGDNLQKLISENRPRYNTIRFESSFVIQPDTEQQNSIAGSSKRDSVIRMEVTPNSSAPRYSTSKIIGNYTTETQGMLRHSVNYKGSELERDKENGVSDDERVSITDKYRSNQWKNYNFIKSNERGKKGKSYVFSFIVSLFIRFFYQFYKTFCSLKIS